MSRLFVMTLICVASLTSACASKPRQQEDRTPSSAAAVMRGPDDLRLGMSIADVKEIWGEPHDVFEAGRPENMNQKWVYYVGLSSVLGRNNARVIYFEGGIVSGWETIDASPNQGTRR